MNESEQLSIFDLNDDFRNLLSNNLFKICKKYELPTDSICIKKGKAIDDVVIKEEAYPKGSASQKTFSILRFEIKNNDVELMIRKEVINRLKLYDKFSFKSLASDTLYDHILFNAKDGEAQSLIELIVTDYYKNYKSSSSFGCCSLYKECSNAGMCLHMNKLYATGCIYKTNLDKGNNFYK